MLQIFSINFVPLDIFMEFIVPEVRVAFGRCRNFATLMSMPEATVHQDNRLEPRENDIWFPWQSLVMEAKPKPQRVKGFS